MQQRARTVVWRDAASCERDGVVWYPKDAALHIARELYQETATTWGVVLEDNKDYIVIASTSSGDRYSDITMIPKRFVLKVL